MLSSVWGMVCIRGAVATTQSSAESSMKIDDLSRIIETDSRQPTLVRTAVDNPLSTVPALIAAVFGERMMFYHSVNERCFSGRYFTALSMGGGQTVFSSLVVQARMRSVRD